MAASSGVYGWMNADIAGRLRNPDEMTPEERLDALADVLARGILHLADGGLLATPEQGNESQIKGEGQDGAGKAPMIRKTA